MTRLTLLASLVLLFAPALAAAQKPLLLTKPDAEFPEAFSQVSGIRELSDGRVLVADAREKLLQIIDFKGRGATRVGREGAGPGEYAMPMRIVALPADSSVVWDGGNARFLMVHPDGKPGRDFRLEGGRQGLGLSVRPLPRGVDARGRIYFEGPIFQLNAAGQLTPSDSAPVLRFDRATLHVDTVAYARLAKGSGSVTPTADGGVRVLTGGAHPLEPRDAWVALPDGRVAVVRGHDYHVDYFTSRTAMTSGAPVPYERIRVNAGVKKMIEELRERTRRNAIGMQSGRGGAPPRGDLPPPPPLPSLESWPEFMPPFLAQAAIARPNGQVWVLRTQRPENDALLYDVFDGTGRVVGHVVLPPKTELVGFGQGTVYVVRVDEDDLQHLQRYRLAMDAKLFG